MKVEVMIANYKSTWYYRILHSESPMQRLIPTGLSVTITLILLCSVASGHTIEDLKKEMKEVSAPLAKITEMYERAQSKTFEKPSAELDPSQQDLAKATAAALREQLHAVQHKMMADHKKAQLQMECVKLLTKIPALERKLQKLEKAGKADEAEQVQLAIDEGKALTTVICPSLSR